MFTLEAIKAKHGDCLILMWGKNRSAAKVCLIDGGPATVYDNYLKPRLQALGRELGREPLDLDLTMVSHIDDDHINGILALAREIEKPGVNAPASIGTLWFNSLEGLLDEEIARPTAASVTASLSKAPKSKDDYWYSQVLASVGQGQELHAFAVREGIDHLMNQPYNPLVLRGLSPKAAKIEGLVLTVIGPDVDELEALRKDWKKKRKKSITAAYADKSIYNLSSIVVLAEYGGKRALLTGDARGDHVIDGLKAAKLMKKDAFHVDLLKLGHHGSKNNHTPEFFEQVTADTYVVSGDFVRFKNPAIDAMKWLAAARKGDNYKIYCTYDLPHMRKIFGNKLIVPKGKATSVTVSI
jgi:beta-lactamase superfamily II metal-dependent hydrolase